MFERLFERVIQTFEPSGKKLSPIPTKHASAGKERRKKSRADTKDRRKSNLRLQDWNDRDKTRRKSTNFIWEGYNS